MELSDDERFAAIGRAAVHTLMPRNEAALRGAATAENVSKVIQHYMDMKYALETSPALEVGGLVLRLARLCKQAVESP